MNETRLDRIKTVLRVTSGNFLEMYDFFLFGIYARQIGQTFFPSDDPYASLMATFLSFAAGFAMRPVRRADARAVHRPHRPPQRPYSHALDHGLRHNPHRLRACLRDHRRAGSDAGGARAAPAGVLRRRRAWRRVRLSVGDGDARETRASTSPGNRQASRSRSWSPACLATRFRNWMAPEAASNWGWRIPFFIGCAIVPFLYMIRRKLEETAEFAARKVHPTTAQIFATLGANWPIVLGGVAMVMMTTVSFYLITVYTPTFGRSVLKLTESDALLVTIAVAVSNFVWLPLSGALSDRIGRKPILLTFASLALLTAYPTLNWLVRAPTFERMLTVELWLSFIYGLLQRRDGRGVDRDHSCISAHVGLLARLQPGDDIGRLLAPDLDLADRAHRRQGRARLLDERRGCLRPDRDACALSQTQGRLAVRCAEATIAAGLVTADTAATAMSLAPNPSPFDANSLKRRPLGGFAARPWSLASLCETKWLVLRFGVGARGEGPRRGQ